jgi:AcrR family transcriptional regulator
MIGLCLERGFGSVTEEALCERAGVDREAFEREYGDLPSCHLRTIETELARIHDRINPIREGDAPWRVRLRGTAYELMRLFVEDERAARFMMFGMRTGDERALLLFARELADLVTLVDEGRGEMDDPGSLDRSTAEQATGGVFNRIYQVMCAGPLPPEREMVPPLLYATVLPYVGPEAAQEELRIAPPPRPE